VFVDTSFVLDGSNVSRELEKGAHLRESNVDEHDLELEDDVAGSRLAADRCANSSPVFIS
jgi:hypothetical protein